MLIAEKESKIAEMDAASTGEAARLKASVETVKGEIAHLKHEHVRIRLLECKKISYSIILGTQESEIFFSPLTFMFIADLTLHS